MPGGKKKKPISKRKKGKGKNKKGKKKGRKTPKSGKHLQEKFRRWLEQYDKKGKKRPIIVIHHVAAAPKTKLKSTTGAQRKLKKVVAKKNTKLLKISEKKRMGALNESPINIETGLVETCGYPRLEFIGLLDDDRQTTLRNTGVTVEGSLNGEAFLSKGPLFGKYKFENFHLHYGEAKDDGSEHTINGERFTMEIHIVFCPYSCECCPSNEVEMQSNKAVLSLLFKECDQPCYYELFSVVSHISEKGKELFVSNNLLHDFKDILSSSQYYNYYGNYTDSSETLNVEWLIFKEILPIQGSQMDCLRQLRSAEDSAKANIAPTKLIGERTVFSPSYFDHIKCRGKPICDCY